MVNKGWSTDCNIFQVDQTYVQTNQLALVYQFSQMLDQTSWKIGLPEQIWINQEQSEVAILTNLHLPWCHKIFTS
jgi:hypothetical protein